MDSVRGIAAFVVVLWHFASAFYPAMSAGPAGVSHSGIDVLVYKSPLSIFIAGNFAVVVFFVLSGFVLTARFFAEAKQTLFPAAVKRYVRLMPVVLVSVLFAYFLIALGLMDFHRAGNLAQSTWLADSYFKFTPSLLTAITQGILTVFTMPLSSAQAYNPLLWTIYYELVGSILIFGLASLVKNHPKRWLLYLIAVIGFINTYFCGFIVGAALADLYISRHQIYDRLEQLPKFYRWFMLIFALAIAAYPVAGDQSTYGKYWNSLTLFSSNLGLSRNILELIAAAILIFLALSWPKLARILELGIFRWLGAMSYALYATHLILIFSLSSWLMVTFAHHLSYNLATTASMIVSLPVMFGTSYVLHKYVEVPSIILANRVGHWVKT